MCGSHNNYTDDCLECIKEVAYAPYLNRYDSRNYFDESKYLNKFVRSSKDVPIYHNPGEKPWRVAKPNTYIGKTVDFNSKLNWLKLSDGDWIFFDSTHEYRTPDATTKELTVAEKAALIAAANANTGVIGGGVGTDVIKAGGKTATVVADVLPEWDAIKWYLIGLAVLIVLFMVYKIMK